MAGITQIEDFIWAPEVEEAISLAIAAAKAEPEKPHYVAFDFDNTMIKNDLGDAYLCRLCMSKTLPDPGALFNFVYLDSRRKAEINAFYQEGDARFAGEFMRDYDALYRSGKSDVGLAAAAFATLKTPPKERSEIIRKTADEIFSSPLEPAELPLKSGGAFLYNASARPRARFAELVEKLREAGIDSVIISATQDELVKYAAKILFGIEARFTFGLKLSTDPLGANLPNPVKPLSWDCGKPFVWKRHFGAAAPLLAFGDSASDFPLLSLARTGVAICPAGGGELEAAAENKGFLIQRV